jgi:hypothetical protein
LGLLGVHEKLAKPALSRACRNCGEAFGHDEEEFVSWLAQSAAQPSLRRNDQALASCPAVVRATPNSSACMPQGEEAARMPSEALGGIGTELRQLLSQAHPHRGNYEVGVMSASSLRAY